MLPPQATIDLGWKLPSTSFTNKNKYICTIGCHRFDYFDAKGVGHNNSTADYAGSCSTPQEIVDYCSQASQPCGASWGLGARGTGDSYVRKDGQIARYDYPDNSWNLYPSATVSQALRNYDHSVANLNLQEDKVIVPNVMPGNSYRVDCSGPSRANPAAISSVSSPWVTVQNNCGEACEVRFGEIVKSLKDNKVAHITETDFKDWATIANDYAGYYQNVAGARETPNPVASGNRFDLESAFDENHTCAAISGTVWGAINPLDGFDKNNLTKLKANVTKGYPIEIGYDLRIGESYLVNNSEDYLSPGAHYVIAYDYKELGEEEITVFGKLSTVQKFQIKVFNSNGPARATLDCLIGKGTNQPIQAFCTSEDDQDKETILNKYLPQVISAIKEALKTLDPNSNDYKTGLHYLDILTNNPKVFYILQEKADGWGYLQKPLVTAREQVCPSNLNLCKKTPKQVIENDIPSIRNMEGAIDNLSGYCYGYSDLVLRIAYLGDFVGYDFHPNDGYIVGAGCDANHQPDMNYINSHPSQSGSKSKKSAQLNPANWLGNVFGTFGKLWPGK
ncbi:MAG: hypothetical protein NT041_01485 [Candidatus Vogelbacteria bacterium]|nr:hypothetical protein [Candidatus Vogelbacteria bacterium]